MEGKISALDLEINSAGSDYTKLQQLVEEKASLASTLDAKMERWVYLNALAEEINNQK